MGNIVGGIVSGAGRAGQAAAAQPLMSTRQPGRRSSFLDAVLGRAGRPELGITSTGSFKERAGDALRGLLLGASGIEGFSTPQLAEQGRTKAALQAGDISTLAGLDPQLAAQAGEVRRDLDTEERNKLLRRIRAADTRETPEEKIVTFRRLNPNLTQEQEAALQAGGLPGIEALVGGQQEDGLKVVGNAVFDPVTRTFITPPAREPAQDPLLEDRRALLQAQADAARARAQPGAASQSTAAKELDKRLAKEVAEFIGGGNVVAATNIARLDDAVNMLRNERGLTGPFVGIGPIATRQFTNPRSAALQQQVQNAVQSSLKATLGAQFARIEGEQLLDRAFAPRLSQEENIRRVEVVADAARQAAQAKQALADHLLAGGTSQNFTGPSVEAIAADLEAVLRQFAQDNGDKEAQEESDVELIDAARSIIGGGGGG